MRRSVEEREVTPRRAGRQKLCVAALLLAALLFGGPALGAGPLDPADVPEPLRPWIDWVLRDHEQTRCTWPLGTPEGTRICAWPTELELELAERSGRFTQRTQVERRLQIELPGDARHWPQEVSVDGRAATVMESNGRPRVELDAGQHVVRGSFEWDSLPELLQVPPSTALLSLRLESEDVDFPQRDAQGRLWLRKRSGEVSDESRLELIVNRRVTDDEPLHLETRIELEVSGRSRETLLGRALPPQFVAMSLTSALPARLDPDGRLRVQLRPGRFAITLTARHRGLAERLEVPEPGGPWADTEVWVFEARPDLRLVTVEGATPIDPQQTELPAPWKGLPAYLMRSGDTLSLVEKRRGDADPAPDLLALHRNWWLDFAGGGYTIQDRIEGEIRRSSRLEMNVPTELGRVELNGRDQLITRLPGTGRDHGEQAAAGIEVPRGAVEIQADSRIDGARARIPAVSWNHDFQELSGSLHLPPGWRLVHAAGVDRAASTWINRWNLLDIFTALVITAAFARLRGTAWGIAAGIGMALSYTEPGAPRWIWLALLAGEAPRRALSNAAFLRGLSVYRGLAFAVLLAIGISFAVTQVRVGLHPALEDLGGTVVTPRQEAALDQEPARGRETEVLAEAPALTRELMREKRSVPSSAYSGFGSSEPYRPDPGAKVTTGPGLPQWQWRRIELSWNGPVTGAQEIRLWLSPPWLTGAAAFTRVGFVAALALCLIPFGNLRGGFRRLSSRGAAAAALLLAASLGAGGEARADFPSNELLEDLRGRLLAAPECAPRCATIPTLALAAGPAALSLELEVDAIAATSVPLPGGARAWIPTVVRLDGNRAEALRFGDDGVLWLRVSPGKHRVVLRGPLPTRDAIELPLPLRPHRLRAAVEGWVLHGLLEDGRVEGTLQLERVRHGNMRADPKLESGELPPFVEVVRSISLGLTWQVQTEVRRLTPIEPSIVLDLPLLPGEAVTTAGIRVESRRVQLVLGPGIRSTTWTSTLEPGSEIVLRAEEASAWREAWRLDVSPIWHVEFDGIPAIHQPSATAARVREWRPRAGESVVLRVDRPAGVEGRTSTIDASALTLDPGLRATDARLDLTIRSSRGGDHRVVLPEAAALQAVTVDGIVRPIRQDDREVTLPLVPGTQHIRLEWRQPLGIGTYFETPEIDLAMESVNASLDLNVPRSRWILATGGPRLGPAVLFWSYLAVLAVIAFALGRVPLTPLRFHHWLLLALGLTQAPLAATAVVVLWLLALGWRGSRPEGAPQRGFRTIQLGLVALTLAAAVALLVSIRTGLLGLPEMQIAGNGSAHHLLRWYQDRSGDILPVSWVFSLPLLAYRLAMLGWALWLTQALLRWLRWGWECFSAGEVWRPIQLRRRAERSGPAPTGS